MRHSESHVRVCVVLLILTVFAVHLPALDLSLNGRNHAVLDSSALEAYARDSQIPLQALYPWLESVDYLEVQSGVNRVFWDATRLGEADWNSALLVKRGGIWEVRVGRDVFSAPDRIAVRGVRRNVDTIYIWSAIDNPGFKNDLLSAFALRSVAVEWRDITQPAYLLSDPPPEGLPHLILLDQLDLLCLDSLLTSSRPVSSRISEWRKAAAPGPLALDAYSPEAALLYLLAENPNLFDAEGNLPTGLTALFDWAAATRKTDLIVTDSPMSALTGGDSPTAAIAVRLPSSEESRSAAEMDLPLTDPPEGTVNLIRLQYAAIPAAHGPAAAGPAAANPILAELVLIDAARIAGNPKAQAGVVIPADPRVVRYFEAYERIGRLAISGQMESIQAAKLINDYVINKNAGE